MLENKSEIIHTIKSLTGLRFVAAFYVFIFHINMGYRAPLTFFPDNILAIINQGYLGVTLFFVLSGFVLTYSQIKVPYALGEIKPVNFISFIFKRFARIYPVYLLGLILCLAIEAIFNHPPPLLIILTSATLTQSYIPFLAMKWYDGGGWSVVNEFFFYLMFPFALPLLLWIKNKAMLFILLGSMICFGSFLGLVYDGIIPSPFRFPYSWAYWFPPLRFNEFLAGMIACILIFKFKFKVKSWLAILFCGLSLIYLAKIGPKLPITVTHNWIIIPSIILLLAALSTSPSNLLFKGLELPFFQYLGKVSYSFYIFQMPLFTGLAIFKGNFDLSLPNWQLAIVLFILNLIGSILIHEFIEKKAQTLLLSIYKNQVHSKSLQSTL